VIIFAPKFADALYRVSAAGGAQVPLTTLDASRKETSHGHPHFLPDGRHFIYHASAVRRENTGIYVGSLDSKETKLLMNTNQSAAYAPPGYLLFMSERTLMAQGFDANKLELKGEPFPVEEQVDLPRMAEPRLAFFSVSETGCWFIGVGVSETFNSFGLTERANSSEQSGRRAVTATLRSHLMKSESRSSAVSRARTGPSTFG
jgi:hypothetical protein